MIVLLFSTNQITVVPMLRMFLILLVVFGLLLVARFVRGVPRRR
jgi:hypothetical protein